MTDIRKIAWVCLKLGILMVASLAFAQSVFAKEYVVGFKKGAFVKAANNKTFFQNRATAVRIFPNLEMMIVDISSTRDLLSVKRNLSVDFIEGIGHFQAPPQVSHAPGVVEPLRSKGLVEYPWGILEVDAPSAWVSSRAGAGIKVLVLDTGVDKDHPNIAKNFVEGRNLISGEDNSDVPYPFFDKNGHGTHVAGTILADGFGTGLVGVAPRASLYAGKVCSVFCDGAAIMAGIDWAIEEGIDVVNMSLGGRLGNETGKAMYQRAEEAGVVVIAASGNDGSDRISYPAKYPHVLSVGAIDEDKQIAPFSNWDEDLDVVAPGVNIRSSIPQGTGRVAHALFDINGVAVSAKAFPMVGALQGSVGDLPIEYVGLGKPEDFEGRDLAGKIALISRGEITFADKAKGAMEAGAEAVVIFNNTSGLLRGTLGGETEIVAVGIDQESGQQIVEALSGEEDSPEEIVIRSDVEIAASDYGELAGTSMATPHVAGVAALVLGANAELTPVQVKSIIKESVVAPLSDNSENKFGQGIVNAFKAIEAAQFQAHSCGRNLN